MKLSPDQIIASVPCRNRHASVKAVASGALVTVPLAKRWWVRPPLTWMFPISSERRVQLDETGAWVLEQCNGKKTVEQIVEALQARHRLSFHEARVPVLQFMSMLCERGIVALSVGKQK
jgi:hypothetical protein